MVRSAFDSEERRDGRRDPTDGTDTDDRPAAVRSVTREDRDVLLELAAGSQAVRLEVE